MKQLWKIGLGILFLMVLGSITVSAAEEYYSSQGVSGDVFGRKTGIIHPFIKVSGTHTENVFNSSDNEDSDFITSVAPGIALAIPGTGNINTGMSSATGAPGGLSTSRQKLFTVKRFQGFLVYNAEIIEYSDNSDEDFTGQYFTGAFQYNVPGRLTVDIANKYQRAQEMWGEAGITNDHATYDDNLAHAILEFTFSSKFSITAGGSYHTLGYKHGINEFRDRDDATFFGSFNYHISPKISLIFEYRQVDVSYEEDLSEILDSSQKQVSAGLAWDITAKSKGALKFGYVNKEFDDSSLDDPSTWTAEASIAHMLTSKTVVTVSGTRGFFETNIQTSDYFTTNRVGLTINQKLTPKLGANLELNYQNDDYDGIDIENDTFSVSPGLSYSPTRWMTCQLAYSYSDRDSDDDNWDYTTNAYTFSITASF